MKIEVGMDTVGSRITFGVCSTLLLLSLLVSAVGAEEDASVPLPIRFHLHPDNAAVVRIVGDNSDELVPEKTEDGTIVYPIYFQSRSGENYRDIAFRFRLKTFDGYWETETDTVNAEELKRKGEYPTGGGVQDLDPPLSVAVQHALLTRPVPTLLLTGAPLVAGLGLIFGYRRRHALLGWFRHHLGGVSEPEQTTFGDYTIKGQLGKGAMGVVYLAENEYGEAAIKSILPEYTEDPEFVKRFERELKACVNLNHPNLLRYYGHGIDSKGCPYSVTERLHGRTLKEVIRSGDFSAPQLASDVVEGTCSALQYLHDRNLIHRDIKPDNIFLCEDGAVKLMDLGLIQGEALTVLTRTGHILGTPAYMAPEQTRNKTLAASDQYALGVILYEILAGRRPFVQPDLIMLAYQHAHATPEPPSDLEPRITPEIEAAVLRMLEKDPAKRFPGMSEVAEALSDKLLFLKWDDDTATLNSAVKEPE